MVSLLLYDDVSFLALIVGYWGGDPNPQTRRRILRWWVDVIGHSSGSIGESLLVS